MKSKLDNYTPDELQELLNMSKNYRDFFERVGLCPKGRSMDTLKKRIESYNLDTSTIDANSQHFINCLNIHRHKATIEDILSNKVPYTNGRNLRIKLVRAGYKEHRCELCGLSEWQGKMIPLELHHKDGNHSNNSLDNLQFLCCNCHALTDNYKGKNVDDNPYERKPRVYKPKPKPFKDPHEVIINSDKAPSREVLKDLVRQLTPFTTLGKMFGVSDKAVTKWCKTYAIPYKYRDIRSYTDEEWEQEIWLNDVDKPTSE